MQKYTLNVKTRNPSNKGSLKQLRKSGEIPGNIYGKGNARAISVSTIAFRNVNKEIGGGAGLIELKDENGDLALTHVKGVQVNPISRIIEHMPDVLEIRCRPSKLPENISVDVSELNVGDAIHVDDLEAIEDVEFLNTGIQVIVSCQPPTVAVVADEPEAAEEAEETSDSEATNEVSEESEDKESEDSAES